VHPGTSSKSIRNRRGLDYARSGMTDLSHRIPGRRKLGMGRNPRTGTAVALAAGKAVRFKPGKGLQALE
jgi:hypothetical protein